MDEFSPAACTEVLWGAKAPSQLFWEKNPKSVGGPDAHTQQPGEQKGDLNLLLETTSPNPLPSAAPFLGLHSCAQLNLPKKQFYSQSELSLRQALLAGAHVSSEAGELARICSRPLGLHGAWKAPRSFSELFPEGSGTALPS